MGLLYSPKLGNSFYYDEDYSLWREHDQDYLYIKAGKENKKEEENILTVDRSQPYPRIIEIIKKQGEFFPLIIIDDELFLQSNLTPPNFSMYKWPNGATLVPLIRKLLPKLNNLQILVAQDDGTRTTLPPVYYALLETGRLAIHYRGRDVRYANNYMSCSSSKLTRARLKLNIIDVRLSNLDYIFTPGFKNLSNTDLLDWCMKQTKKGVILFTKLDKDLPLANLMVNYAKNMYFYCYLKEVETYDVMTINPKKQARKELLPFLIRGTE